MKKINIGIIGAGTVGSGVIKIINQNRDTIFNRTNIQLNIEIVCDKNYLLSEEFPNIKFTQTYTDVTSSPTIDIIVELIGGTGIAYEVVKSAILNKKMVVTANKALLSEKGEELFELAEKNGVEIGFEAAVGGTIPIIRSIKTSLVSNDYQSIYGILNGTTNYILSKMESENLEYDVALKQAQDLGFAEKDPSFDVDGIDTAHKVSILGGLAFGKRINTKQMYIEGISNISKAEINFAKMFGYRIKLLGVCKKHDENTIEARVHPTMIPLSHPLSSVMNETNAVYVKTNFSGPLIFIGAGAGSFPTASAIISDLVFYSYRIGSLDKFREVNFKGEATIFALGDTLDRYYLRFNTIDKSGVLGRITNALAKYNISISSLRQNEPNVEPVEVIIITHSTKEGNIRSAIKEIDEFDCIKNKSIMVRIEDKI